MHLTIISQTSSSKSYITTIVHTCTHIYCILRVCLGTWYVYALKGRLLLSTLHLHLYRNLPSNNAHTIHNIHYLGIEYIVVWKNFSNFLLSIFTILNSCTHSQAHTHIDKWTHIKVIYWVKTCNKKYWLISLWCIQGKSEVVYLHSSEIWDLNIQPYLVSRIVSNSLQWILVERVVGCYI